MPELSRKAPRDPNQLAKFTVDQSIGEIPKEPPPEKNPAAVALGRMGWLKGGRARAESLTPMERKEIAIRAAKARWSKKKDENDKKP